MTLYHIFLECFDTLPARHLLLNNLLCKIFFAHINISDILQILQECDFYNKIKIFTLLHFLLLKFSCASNDAREWAGALWWKIQHVQCLIWLCQHTCNALNEFKYSFIHATSPMVYSNAHRPYTFSPFCLSRLCSKNVIWTLYF